MTADEVMLKQPSKKKEEYKIDEQVLSECFKKKDIIDKAIDSVNKIDDLFGKVKPYIRVTNLADPLNNPDYDGEGAKRALEVGIKISF